MRRRKCSVSSTGDSLRFASSALSSPMVANERESLLVIRCRRASLLSDDWRLLEHFLLAPQIAEGSDVSNDQGHAELVLRAHLPESQPPVLKSQPAAGAIVADLHQLVLQQLLLDVVTEPERGVKAAAVQVSIARQQANLVRERLQNAGIVDGKMRHRKIEILIRTNLEKRAGGREPLAHRVIFQTNLRVIDAARGHPQIAVDGRKMARFVREGKGRN